MTVSKSRRQVKKIAMPAIGETISAFSIMAGCPCGEGGVGPFGEGVGFFGETLTDRLALEFPCGHTWGHLTGPYPYVTQRLPDFGVREEIARSRKARGDREIFEGSIGLG